MERITPWICPRCFSGSPSAGVCRQDGASLVAADGLISGYVLHAELGKGSFGRVWRGEVQRAHLQPLAVAVKLFAGQLDPAEVERFRQEAMLLSQLKHSHIIEILHYGELDGRPWFSMELVPQDLSRYCQARRERIGEPLLPLTESLSIAQDVADALSHLHALPGLSPDRPGLVHRDIKPGNIAISVQSGRPRAKLLDFGICRPSDSETRPIGSPGYFPLEQAQGQVCPASDVYALGAVLYQLLSGRRPSYVLEPKRPPEAPEAIWALVARMTRLKAEERPTAASVVRQLERLRVQLDSEGRPSAVDLAQVQSSPAQAVPAEVAAQAAPAVPAQAVSAAPAQAASAQAASAQAVPAQAAPAPKPRRLPTAGVVLAGLTIGGLFTTLALHIFAERPTASGTPVAGTTPAVGGTTATLASPGAASATGTPVAGTTLIAPTTPGTTLAAGTTLITPAAPGTTPTTPAPDEHLTLGPGEEATLRPHAAGLILVSPLHTALAVLLEAKTVELRWPTGTVLSRCRLPGGAPFALHHAADLERCLKGGFKPGDRRLTLEVSVESALPGFGPEWVPYLVAREDSP